MEHSKCIQHVSIQLISWETHCKFDRRTWGDYNLGTFQMYPACSGLGKLESHGRGHLKYIQPIPTGHIGVTCCLYSQCIQHVPSGYLGPCPQCQRFATVVQDFPNFGWRLATASLRAIGVIVPEQRVRDSLACVNGTPGTFSEQRVHRRRYKVVSGRTSAVT